MEKSSLHPQHDHAETFPHVHDPREQKAIVNRLARAIGHLESVKRMVEEDRDCSEVLIQLSAVEAALRNTGKKILRHHMEHCIIDAARHGQTDRIDDLYQALDQFIR